MDALMEEAFLDMEQSLQEERIEEAKEEDRLRDSLDPNEHLCGRHCKYIELVPSSYSAGTYVCRVSGRSWAQEAKWNHYMAGHVCSSDKEGQTTTRHTKAIVRSVDTGSGSKAKADEDTTFSDFQTHVVQVHHIVQIQLTNVHVTYDDERTRDKISADLMVAHLTDRRARAQSVPLNEINDIMIEIYRRCAEIQQRAHMWKRLREDPTILTQFVHTLCQLVVTLWKLIVEKGNRTELRKERLSFPSFASSLLQCLKSGYTFANGHSIVPGDIWLFQDVARKHRESAHYATSVLQRATTNMPLDQQVVCFQPCIDLARTLSAQHAEVRAKLLKAG